MNREKTPAAGRIKRRSTALFWLILLLVAAGICIIAYPTVSDWGSSYQAVRAIATYDRAVSETDGGDLAEMLDAAREYNAAILMRDNPYVLQDGELERYNELLNLSGDGLMGYIQIPSIQVNIPFYHGTNEEILKEAVGHIEWTSLPVGGENTHAVLSGHRGLPSAKLFTDLNKVQIGERFTVTVLGQAISYEIDQILTVLPEDVWELEIIPGGDYCTLVTCTPYGINTHRLLVRGHRVENEEPVTDAGNEAEERLPTIMLIPAVGIPIMFFFLLGMLLFYGKARPIKKKQVKTTHENENE